MKCPSCKAAVPEGAVECPSCGVIFAKFEERRRRERAEAERALAEMNLAPPPTVHPYLGRVIAGVVLTAWAAVMGYLVFEEMLLQRARKAAAAAAPAPIPVIMSAPIVSRIQPAPPVAVPVASTAAAKGGKAADGAGEEASPLPPRFRAAAH
jgi:hypothetical protein